MSSTPISSAFGSSTVSYLTDGTPAGCRVRANYPRKAVALDLSTEDGRNRATMNDYFVNAAARSGWGTPSITEATDYELVRLSYDYWLMITLYQNHWICGKIVDIPARHMVKAWPRITSEMDPKDITKIDGCIRKTRVKYQICEAIKWARLFGGAGALMVIEGQENRMDEPLDLESIGIGAFRGLIPFDRWSGIQPVGELSTDITKPQQFNLPKFYEVWSQNGGPTFRVHSSRILRFTGPTVPQPEYQAMSYWGISVFERVYEELRKRDNMSWNILNLTYRANLIGMKVPALDQMLSGLGMNQRSLVQFQAIMQQQNQAMSNQSMLLLPKDGEMTATQYSFGGVAEVYEQFQREIAGAAEMPVTLLYGDTKGGLNQTNDADFRIYQEKIALDQDDQLRPQLEALYPVIMMSTTGEVPDDIDLRFPSIQTLNDKEKADLAKAQGDTIIGYRNLDIYTRSMALKDIKQTSDVTEIGSNITASEIAAAEEQETEEAEARKMMPPLPMGEEDLPQGGPQARPARKPQAGATDVLVRRAMCGIDEFQESEHPRGSGEKGGQFVKGSGGASASASAHKAAIPKSEFPLTEKQHHIEEQFRQQVEADPDAAMAEYHKRFGNVLNADNAKELSPDYLKDRATAAPAVHETASWLVKQLYKKELAQPAPPGKDNTVVFTAGGAGAGKTTAIENSPDERDAVDRAQIIYDGTLRPSHKAMGKVDEALKAGKQAQVMYVYRNPIEAFQFGVIKRAIRQEKEHGSGRTVPIDEFVAQYTSIDKSMEDLSRTYSDNPNFHMSVIDNSFGPGQAQLSSLASLPPSPDPVKLKAELMEVLNAEYKSGRVSRKIYEATVSTGAEGEVGM